MRRALSVSLVALLWLFVFASAGPAQVRPAQPAGLTPIDSALEAQTSSVASQLRCPVCQGESIQESPAELAQQLRSLVRDQLRAGQSPDQVKAYFVSRYGEWILLQPKATGMNVLIYALPVAALIAGLIVIGVALRRWTRPPAATAAGDG